MKGGGPYCGPAAMDNVKASLIIPFNVLDVALDGCCEFFLHYHNPIARIGHSQVNWASISKSPIKMSPAWAKF